MNSVCRYVCMYVCMYVCVCMCVCMLLYVDKPEIGRSLMASTKACNCVLDGITCVPHGNGSRLSESSYTMPINFSCPSYLLSACEYILKVESLQNNISRFKSYNSGGYYQASIAYLHILLVSVPLT